MKDTPPSLASATANLSPDTDCMIADTSGIFMVIADSSPRRYRTSGVRSETFAGTHSEEEYPGISRYSLKVCDGSLRKVAMLCSLSPAKGHRNDFFYK